MPERITLQVDAIGNFSNLIGEVGKFNAQLKNLKLPDKITSKLEKGFDNVESKVSHFQSLLSKGITTKGDFSKLVSSAHSAEAAINSLKDDIRAINDKDIQIAVANSADVKKAEESLKKVLNMEKQLSSFGTSKGTGVFGEKEVANMQKIASTSAGLKKRFSDVTNAIKTGNIDQASAALQKLIAHAQKYQAIAEKNGKSTQKWDDTIKWAQGVERQLDGMVTKANQARTVFNQIQSGKFDQIKNSVNGIASSFDKAATSAKHFINAEVEGAARTERLNEQVGHLRTQANYFFGLQNMGRLIARGIREAAESVRDLDKAMTETAVVTDFSVSDMWNMLPEYTKLANKLGATTQGAYETMTLYFQQGLNKEQTFEIGEETMKMARIAGLDYAQTTNMMTAALRGFNMELNQTSAKRVNDVYSELAAITASDTRELGLAMERTASIAHSAGMDFGNTTAFLAQMIETTREAPENLGTAMKTIIARFQELKQNPYEISEVEGEEVDFNRVDKALKSIGVDLMDNRDKFRDLDDVFMDISERWDGLSQTQQRYIATIAAGARQQSRFLAMVQNYDRLKQLTDAAANSEGASEVQFSKTLESYEAKVNKLKNAWQQYTMSLANNQAIKKTVDWLKDIIEFGNKIIKTFGKVGSVIGGDFGKGLLELAGAFGLGALGFKGLRGGANLGLKLLGGMTVKGATAGGGMFPGGGRDGSGLAAKITNPIVNAINRLTTVVSGQAAKMPSFQTAKQRSDLIKERRQNLYTTARQRENYPTLDGGKFGNTRYKKGYKSFNATSIRKQFSGLEAEEQRQIYRSVPTIRKALQNGYAEAYKGMNLDKAGQEALIRHFKQIDNAVKSGKISASDAFRHLYNPASVAKAINNPEVSKALNKAVEQQMKSWGTQKHAKISQRLKEVADKRGLVGQERQQFYRDQKRQIAGQELNISGQTTAQLGKVAGAMTAISSKASMAGQSVMGLGMALDSIGMHGAGAILMTVGNGLIGIGMAAEGASAGVKKLGAALNFLKANPIIAIASAAAAVGIGLSVAHKKMVKDAQKTGREIVNTYKDTIEKTEKELKNLSDYEENWATWSAGVDENGNNINLGTGEYEDYLKAVKEITQAHPELIKGYNSLGNAIVDNNTVLREARKINQEEAKSAKETYLNSYEQIVKRQKSTKRWQKANEGSGLEGILYGKSATSTYQVQAQDALDALRKIDGADQILQNFGVTWSKTGEITADGIEIIRTKGNDLINSIKENVDGSDEELNKLVTNASDKIATFGTTVKGLEEVSKDTYDWGMEYAASKGYDKIDSGLIAPFQTAIERIAEKGLDEATAKDAIDAVGRKYQDLGGHLEEFQDIQEQINELQSDFGKNLDSKEYSNKVKDIVAPMDDWIKTLEHSTDESDKVLAQWIKNQKEKFTNFTESLPTLDQAFNSLSSQITAANSAYDNWSKQNEGGDLYTGVENYKKMFDEVNDDIDNIGHGSTQWWTAAQSMFGDDYVFDHTEKQIKSHMEQVGKYLEEGAKGVDTFMTDLRDNKLDNTLDKDIFGVKKGKKPYKVSDFIETTEDGGLNFDKIADLSEEEFSGLAEGIGLSTELFTSLLNKARQFTNIKFGNVETMREALYGSDFSVVGQGSTGGNRNLYVRESEFRQQGLLAGLRPNEIKDYQKQMEKAGTIFLKSASKMDKADLSKYIEDWGISTGKAGDKFQTTTDAFIRQFDKLGYSKDEIQELYKTAIGGDNKLLEDAKDVNFSEAYEVAKEKNADPSIAAVTSIDGTTSSILGVTQAIATGMGILTKATQNDIKNATKDTREHASDLRLGTGSDYDSTKKQLESDVASLEDVKASLEAGQSNYEEGTAEWKEYQAQIDSVNNTLKIANDALAKVTEASYAEAQAKQEVKDFTQSSGGQAALKAYNENGWGNTNFASRSQNAINWGDDPTKNKNWENLNTWGKQNAKQWAGTESTYWSKGNHFGATGKNKGVEIAFTPIQQKKDGSLEVLAKDEVDAYMEAITKAASDSKGNVDVNKLMGLDAGDPAYQEELKALGIESKGLIMGAFTGDNAAAASGQFGALEHLFSEGLIAEETDFAGLKEAAENAATLGENLSSTGTLGTQAAESLKTSFLQVNSEALSGLNTDELYEVASAAGIAKEEVNDFASEHPELNLKVETEDEDFQKTKEEVQEEESTEHVVTTTYKVDDQTQGDQPQSNLPDVPQPSESAYIAQVDTSQIEEAQDKISTFNGIVNTGGTYSLTVNGLSDLQKAQKAATKLANAKESKTISVKTGKVDQKSVKDAKDSIGDTKAKMKVGADTKDAISSANKAKDTIDDKKASIDVSANFTGTWSKEVSITVKKTTINTEKPHTGGFITTNNLLYKAKGGTVFQKKGTDIVPAMLTPGEYVQKRDAVQFFGVDFMQKINHKDLAGALQSLGSAAKGSRGRLGPKGKGGLTLTGEKGFEIAWIPSENRSMILGAAGPQMVDLPSDTVVWNNKQSKRIINQKVISAGSKGATLSGGWTPKDTSSNNPGKRYSNNDNNNNNNNKDKKKQKEDKKRQKEDKDSKKKQTKIIQKAGKINTWWWDMTKKVEATQRRIDKISKKIEKEISKVGATLSSVASEAKGYIKKLNLQIKYNTKMRDKADDALRRINTGKKTEKQNKKIDKAQAKVNATRNKYRKSQAAYTKKETSKNKKRLKKDKAAYAKAKKNLKKAKTTGVNYSTISYEYTKRTRTKKNGKWSKWTNKKVNKKSKVNLAPYIYYDAESGAYQIDYNKINKKFGKNGSKAKAVKEAAEKKLEEYQSKKNTAEDNITKAEDALNEFTRKMYETFFAWENELTNLWEITQKLEATQRKLNRAEAYTSLLETQFRAFGKLEGEDSNFNEYAKKLRNSFSTTLSLQVQVVKDQIKAIKEQKQSIVNLATSEDEEKTLEKVQEKLNKNKEYQEKKKILEDNKKFIKEEEKSLDNTTSKNKTKKTNKKYELKDSEGNTIKLTLDQIKEYTDNLEKEVADLKQFKLSDEEKETYKNYAKELETDINLIKDAQKYVNPVLLEDGTIDFDFNQDLLEEDKLSGEITSEKYEEIKKYIENLIDESSNLDSLFGDLYGSLADIATHINDLNEQWADYSMDLLTYYEEDQQDEIDRLTKLSDSINNTLKDLLDNVKKNLDARRQHEDNTQTELDISRKQQRLAALEADTSGGNQVEIAQLRKEIADSQKDYGRTLEDQLLDHLQDSADEAEKQRERQISLLQSLNTEVNNAAKVNDWMDNPEAYKEEIKKAFYNKEEYEKVPHAKQLEIEKDFKEFWIKLTSNRSELTMAETAYKLAEKETETENGENLIDTSQKVLETTVKDTKELIDATVDAATETSNDSNKEEEEEVSNIEDELASVEESINTLIDNFEIEIQQPGQEEDKNDDGGGNEGALPEENKEKTKEEKLAEYEKAKKLATSDKATSYNEIKDLMEKGHSAEKGTARILQDLANKIGWEKVLTAIEGHYSKYRLALTFKSDNFKKAYETVFGEGSYKKNRKKSGYKPYEYATGGLNKMTGPAWLDGTPSKPELVLNAQDTKNFMALRDILGSVMSSTSSINNSASAAMYEININVDHINNDYDVDKIAARVKKDIVKGSGYRNVTQIRNLR